jgi:predicted PurR-regulated permease PerM
MTEERTGPTIHQTFLREEEPRLPAPRGALEPRSAALQGMLLLAVLYTLYFARSFIVPLVVVFMLDALFSPFVRRLRRLGIARHASAALVVAGLVGAVATSVYGLSGPAAAWMAKAPASIEKAESRLRTLLRPLERVGETVDQVEDITDVGADTAVRVRLQDRTFMQALFGNTQNLLAVCALVCVLLYFTLASGDLFLTKVIKLLPTLQDKKRAVQIARETEDRISSYLGAVTLVNLAFGLVTGTVMHQLGMPNPVLWGVLAAVTNYIPYLGAAACMLVLGLVALVQFDTLTRALVVPLAFLVLNLLESYLFTPLFVGRQLSLNPVVVFIGVLFWSWIWGVTGAVIAVPLLAALKIVCDHVEGLVPVGEFIGD